MCFSYPAICTSFLILNSMTFITKCQIGCAFRVRVRIQARFYGASGFDYTDIFVKNKEKSVLIRDIRAQKLTVFIEEQLYPIS